MRKQKFTIRVAMNNVRSRTKAMTIAVSTPGVLSAKLCGDSLDIIVVIGDGVDITKLTVALRRRVGFTEVVSVQSVGREVGEEQEERGAATRYRYDNEQSFGCTPYQYSYGAPQVYCSMPHQDCNQDSCTIQ